MTSTSLHHFFPTPSSSSSPPPLGSDTLQPGVSAESFGQFPTSPDFLCTDHFLLLAPPAVSQLQRWSYLVWTRCITSVRIWFPWQKSSKRFDHLASPNRPHSMSSIESSYQLPGSYGMVDASQDLGSPNLITFSSPSTPHRRALPTVDGRPAARTFPGVYESTIYPSRQRSLWGRSGPSSTDPGPEPVPGVTAQQGPPLADAVMLT